jgi:predicted deacylase
LIERAEKSNYLVATCVGEVGHGEVVLPIPRFVFMGDRSGGDTVRVALIAALRGDEPEGTEAVARFLEELDRWPELARGYHLYAYPIANPTGFAAGTARNAQGVDLAAQFWNRSSQPEVYYLERELGALRFHGVVTLQVGDSGGSVFRVHTPSATLASAVGESVVRAAQRWLPGNGGRDAGETSFTPVYITGTEELNPRPFEIALELPRQVSRHAQIRSAVAGLKALLEAYRGVISFGLNL